MKLNAKRAATAAILVIAVLAVGGAAFLLSPHLYLPRPQEFADRLAPRIVAKPDVRALTVAFDGDPEQVIGEAYRSLFGTYYRMKGVPKGPDQPAPFARYENFSEETLAALDESDLKSVDWRGYVAIPVPGTVAEPPEGTGRPGYPAGLETVAYGTVAEIVHLGPYETEQASIARLLDHIEAEGYRIVGMHEEEYLRGPGVPLVRPESYITVIRYRVERE